MTFLLIWCVGNSPKIACTSHIRWICVNYDYIITEEHRLKEILSKLAQEWEPMEDNLASCLIACGKPPKWRTSLGRLFRRMVLLTIKKSFLVARWNHSQCNFTCSSLTFPWGERFHPLCSHTLNTGILWWDPLSEPSFLRLKDLTAPIFPHRASSAAFCLSSWTLSHQSMSFLSCGGQKWTQCYSCGVTSRM